MTNQKNSYLPVWLGIPFAFICWVVTALVTIFYVLSGILFALPLSWITLNKKGTLFHSIAGMWGKTLVALNPLWNIQMEGSQNIRPGQTYCVIANHQSLLDILVMLSALPIQFKFLAKQELFSIPFLGWHMFFAGYIPIERSSRDSGKKAQLTAMYWIARKISVVFFPEGTRSRDGQIREFKMGAFKIAAEKKVDILPVVIDGTGDALPKHSWQVGKTVKFKISIGKPVSVKGMAGSLVDLREEIREEMINRLNRLRGK